MLDGPELFHGARVSLPERVVKGAVRGEHGVFERSRHDRMVAPIAPGFSMRVGTGGRARPGACRRSLLSDRMAGLSSSNPGDAEAFASSLYDAGGTVVEVRDSRGQLVRRFARTRGEPS